MKYVLITAARNESSFIERTLEAVVAQTERPERWVIVDDGSTDETPRIVERYTQQYQWIELLRRPQRADRSFAGKAYAVRAGLERIQGIDFQVLGNIDADVSFDADYLGSVVAKFEEDPKLGVAGTPFTEVGGYDSMRDSFEGQNYVAGPCQLFRYECWQDIGGYVANKAGGVDWIAVMTARMNGWKVQAFAEKRFHHHRSMGTAERSILASMFSYGEKDYYLGGSPLWQVFRCIYRMAKRPFITGGLALLAGYISAALRRVPLAVSTDLKRFHRAEQMEKLKAVLGALLTMKKADNFAWPASQSR